jgi:prevent-host-death family protein
MAIVGIRELSQQTSRVIREFEDTGEPVVVTREGRPIGALVPISQRQVEDLVLATAPQFRADHVAAQEDVAAGRTRSIEEIADERGVELPAPEVDEGEVVEVQVEPLQRAVEVEFSPLSEVLAAPVAGQILSEANEEVGSLSGEVLGAISTEAQDAPAEEEELEVIELTAAVYGRYFRHRFLEEIAKAGAEQAIRESRYSAGRAMRGVRREIFESGDISLDAYRASLRGMKLAWETQEGEGSVEAAPGLGEVQGKI